MLQSLVVYEWHDIPDDDYWKTECEKARKELAKVTRDRDKFKAMPMKYRRMTFNVELQEQLTAAKQLIEQVKELLKINDENSDEILSLIAEYQKGGE